MERDVVDDSKNVPVERVFGLRNREVNVTTVAITLAAISALISYGFVSQLGAIHLIPFWIILGVVLAVCAVLWRFKINF